VPILGVDRERFLALTGVAGVGRHLAARAPVVVLDRAAGGLLWFNAAAAATLGIASIDHPRPTRTALAEALVAAIRRRLAGGYYPRGGLERLRLDIDLASRPLTCRFEPLRLPGGEPALLVEVLEALGAPMEGDAAAAACRLVAGHGLAAIVDRSGTMIASAGSPASADAYGGLAGALRAAGGYDASGPRAMPIDGGRTLLVVPHGVGRHLHPRSPDVREPAWTQPPAVRPPWEQPRGEQPRGEQASWEQPVSTRPAWEQPPSVQPRWEQPVPTRPAWADAPPPPGPPAAAWAPPPPSVSDSRPVMPAVSPPPAVEAAPVPRAVATISMPAQPNAAAPAVAPVPPAAVPALATTAETAPAVAQPPPPSMPPPPSGRRRTRRFSWQTDPTDRFTFVSPELVEEVGPLAGDVVGQRWREVADRLGLDPQQRVDKAFAARATWSGQWVDWPADDGALVPIDLAALAIADEAGKFGGFRGFGLVRAGEARHPAGTPVATEPPAAEQPAAEPPPAEPPPAAPSPAKQSPPAAAPAVAAVAPVAPSVGAPAAAAPQALPPAPPPAVASIAPPVSPPSDSGAATVRPAAAAVPIEPAAAAPAEAPAATAWPPPPPEFDAPPRAVRAETTERPAGGRLSRPEQEALHLIASALGARIEGDEADALAETTPSEHHWPEVDLPPPATDGAPVVHPAGGNVSPFLPPPVAGRNGRTAGAAPEQPAETDIVDRMPVGILICRNGDVVHANPAALALLGHRSVAALAAAGGLAAVFATPAPDAPAERRVAVERADGTRLPVTARLHRVPWQGGQALMVVLSPEAAAGEAAPSLPAGDGGHAVVDALAEAVLVVDRSGVISAANPAAAALLGRPAGEIEGTLLTHLVALDSRLSVGAVLADVLGATAGAATVERDLVVLHPVRGQLPVAAGFGRLGGDRAAGLCVVMRDVTRFRDAEAALTAATREAQRASAQKSEVLARVSHEIRTPLNAIIGFAEVMLEEKFGPLGNERYREYLRDVRASGAHIMSLVNDLLDLAKIEAGKAELALEPVAINEIVQSSIALIQPKANAERVIVRSTLAGGLPDVLADTRSLRQILLNLLSNAVKFNGPGGQVIVSTRRDEAGGVSLRVRDTGIGMSDDDIALALEPFRRVDGGREGGTGLGLPLTKALVEANAATFSIRSAPGQGTLVEVIFPAARVLAA
jgi:signal transduction histidine kinase